MNDVAHVVHIWRGERRRKDCVAFGLVSRSRRRCERSGRAMQRRAARAQPAVPPPTILTSAARDEGEEAEARVWSQRAMRRRSTSSEGEKTGRKGCILTGFESNCDVVIWEVVRQSGGSSHKE